MRITMPIDPALRSLDTDIPACPQVLVQLSLLMNDEGANTQAIAGLIEGDMALASAVVRAVNTAMFGLLRRVETVRDAVRYLGTREVSAITFEMGLRAAFPPGPLLDALWQRAGQRGLVMGRAAAQLDIDPWLAHTAGLFAESGQAVLYAHDPTRYAALAATTAQGSPERLAAEIEAFGVSHAALGAALCHAWGVASEVAEAVLLRPLPAGGWPGQASPAVHQLLALGAVVDGQLENPAQGAEALEGVAFEALARGGGIEPAQLRNAVTQAMERLADAG